jgi:hypothetical protein
LDEEHVTSFGQSTHGPVKAKGALFVLEKISGIEHVRR